MNPFSIIAKVFRFFSVYIDPFEKHVDRFLKNVRRKSKKDLEALMQQDLVKLTIFLEYKFKGYKKLKKRYRKKLYEHAGLIAKDFVFFFDEHKEEVAEHQKSLDIPSELKSDERMTYLLGILAYLKPGERLQYQEAATFEKLLRDPTSEMLVGDCNQITTLYIYLYSLRFPVGDLHVKILPEHICLHYKGVDIETTNSTLAHYDDYTYLSKVEEIVAANLLDISDPSEKQFDISPASMLKSAELAFHFSSHRQTVEKNLFIAYYNMAVYYANKKNFSKATLFANKSGRTRLQKDITRMEAVDHLKAKRYKKAMQKFKRIGDLEGEKACYQNELADLFGKTKSLKTVGDYKHHKSTLRRMKELGMKVGNQKVVDFVNDILKKL
jgi:TPR repeat protein